jgi:hypothetical protein
VVANRDLVVEGKVSRGLRIATTVLSEESCIIH